MTLCVIYDVKNRRAAITRVFKNGWFERFARKERIADSALRDAVERAESGLVDAELGGGVIKQRVARPGKGKSGGYRTLILFRQGDRAIFAFGFAKSAQANISKADLALLRDAATEALEWNDEELDRLVASGTLVEIDDGNDDEE
ncbi:type II toxin-antitoxin system RelE/ParE family toxin [Sphingobium sp. AN558]|uniref:type II toxin-antitoxin system RelE/ParE family toxin n=1 Tax=Sphingobium sp. AN558 TaxID=3133442 RepID=UPI0030BFE9A8